MPCDELLEFLRHLLEPAAYEKAQAMVRGLTDTSSTDETKPPGGAMDQRPVYAMDSTSAGRLVADPEMAISEVEGTLGRHTVMACNSAASVFAAALKHMGIPTAGVHRDAFPEMFRGHVRARRDGGYRAPSRAGSASFARTNPDVARIKVL